jgi:tetrahydromethanopterin S-methyltransferase subunit G
VNLAGVKRIMELRARLDEMERRIEELQAQLAHRRAIAMPGRRTGADIVPIRTIVRFPWSEGPR